MARVKICGLSTVESVETAIDAGADYVAFNFYAKSPRNVSLPQAAQLAEFARGCVKTVALVVDASDTEILAIQDAVKPDYFQTHGSETPERVTEITRLTSTPVIKAIKVATGDDIASARRPLSCLMQRHLNPWPMPFRVAMAFLSTGGWSQARMASCCPAD
jgi:phosphoribosylanthranilate isomerase